MTNYHKLFYKTFLICLYCLIYGCASNSTKLKTSSKSSKIPILPKKLLPGGNGSNWRYLGRNSEFTAEIDESSIYDYNQEQDKIGIYKITDRKRIIDTYKYKDELKYKYIITDFMINCKNIQYKTLSSTIYDTYGILIKKLDYKNPQWLPVKSNTFAELQYKYVCLNYNRSLGY